MLLPKLWRCTSAVLVLPGPEDWAQCKDVTVKSGLLRVEHTYKALC